MIFKSFVRYEMLQLPQGILRVLQRNGYSYLSSRKISPLNAFATRPRRFSNGMEIPPAPGCPRHRRTEQGTVKCCIQALRNGRRFLNRRIRCTGLCLDRVLSYAQKPCIAGSACINDACISSVGKPKNAYCMSIVNVPCCPLNV